MRTRHPSDDAFETWVTSGDGEEILRTHVVHAAFRMGWNARAAEVERLQMSLDSLKAVAQEVSKGETSRSALRVALAQIEEAG